MRARQIRGSGGGIALLLLALLLAAAMPLARSLAADPTAAITDPAELARSWAAARVFLPAALDPKAHGFSLRTMTAMRGILDKLPASRRYPTVISMHGCAGLWQGSEITGDFLAAHG